MGSTESPTRLADRYVLGDVLGTGGGSTVRQGVDELLDRPVAVKMLHAAAVETANPAGRARFLNEARSMARFDHPHVVPIYDAGEEDGVLYLVMASIEGPTLARRIADDAPLPITEAVDIVEQILDALSAVHAAGYVHRDVKPANVLIDRTNRVYLTDFGIAKQLDDLEESLTTVGTVLGTPAYLAPEQAAGATLGPSTDVFAVGLLLADLVSVHDADGRAIAATPDHPLAAVIARATQSDPDDRYQSASEMAAALRDSLRTETAVMPAGALMADDSTRAMPIAAAADNPTSIMVLPEPASSSDRSRPAVLSGFASASELRQHPWVLGTLALVILLVVVAIATNDGRGFGDLPTAPATESTVVVPATTTPVPVVPTVVPDPTVPVVPVAPPPAEDAPAQDVGDTGGGSRGNGGGKPDKPERPEKP